MQYINFVYSSTQAPFCFLQPSTGRKQHGQRFYHPLELVKDMSLHITQSIVGAVRYRCSHGVRRRVQARRTNVGSSIFAMTQAHTRSLSSQVHSDSSSFVWDWFSCFLARKINRITSFFPPPPAPAPKNALVVCALVIACHVHMIVYIDCTIAFLILGALSSIC